MLKLLIKLFTPKKYKEGFLCCKNFLKGKKSYLVGFILVLQGSLKIIEQICGMEGISELVPLIQNIANHEGFLMLMNGLGIIGIRAGIDNSVKK